MLKAGKHIILWIVALSILNTSIDIVDDGAVFQTLSDQADDGITYTEIESIVEYLVSETSDHDEQFPDSTGNDQQSILKKAAGFDFSLPEKRQRFLSPVLAGAGCTPSAREAAFLLPSGYINRLIQPPDFSA
ncbi:hypothetical protein JMG10_21650 [Nostoc ellipsosporum NOK]|nr:hypothetical protein [Nostoc ellipsosporum NOK]